MLRFSFFVILVFGSALNIHSKVESTDGIKVNSILKKSLGKVEGETSVWRGIFSDELLKLHEFIRTEAVDAAKDNDYDTDDYSSDIGGFRADDNAVSGKESQLSYIICVNDFAKWSETMFNSVYNKVFNEITNKKDFHLASSKFTFMRQQVFLSKTNRSCCLAYLSITEANHLMNLNTRVSDENLFDFFIKKYPTVLKIRQGIIDYIYNKTPILSLPDTGKKDEQIDLLVTINSEFLHGDICRMKLKQFNKLEWASMINCEIEKVAEFSKKSVNTFFDSVPNYSKNIEGIMKKIVRRYVYPHSSHNSHRRSLKTQGRDLTNCQHNRSLIHETAVNYRNSFILSGIQKWSKPCFVLLINHLKEFNEILKLSIRPKVIYANYEAKGFIQSGRIYNEPYHDAGLTGKQQTVAIADSGLDDLSCFFEDTSGLYASNLVKRDGTVQMQRRKVIQYVSYADAYDDEGGHGTHVAGKITI